MAVTPVVRFEVIHENVMEVIAIYCARHPKRNHFIQESPYIATWSRPVREDGKGTSEGNGRSDFLRMVARASLTFPISSTQWQRGEGWVWNFRKVTEGLVRIINIKEIPHV